MQTIRWILVLGLAWWSALAQPAQAGETLRYAGATTLQKYFMPEAAKLFLNETGTRTRIDGGNTTPGIKALIKGEVDMAGAGRFLTPAEKSQHLVEHFLGWDVLAIVTPQSNPVTSLSQAQLQDIFSGTITNWQAVGGPDLPIVVVTNPAGSGMRDAVRQAILKDRSFTPLEVIAAIVAQADQQTALFPGGITALSQSMVDDPKVRLIAVDGVVPNHETVANGTYPLSKPLILVTRGRPQGELKRFIDLATSSRGQAILARHFVPAKAP